MKGRSFGLILLIVLPLFVNAQQITIDGDTEYQVIDGFGGMNHTTWVKDFNDDQRKKIFNNEPGNMGLSILRIHIDPNSSRFSDHLPTASYAMSQGAKIFATPWDPPSNLIEPIGNTDDTYLPASNYGAYLDHLNSFDAFMKANGVPLYAISVQNEPDIGEWIDWTPSQILSFVKNYAQDIDNRVIAPESFNFNRNYSDPILNDSVASSHVEIIGGHIYGSGLRDYPLAREKGKQVWMTEHLTGHESPEVNDWDLALDLAIEINDCMKANFNAYVWWYIRRFYSLITDDGNISHKGYVMSHFSKFVRPNAIRIDATITSATNIHTTAFKTDTSLTAVIINNNITSKEVTFTIDNVNFNELTVFTSTDGNYLINNGTLTPSEGTYTTTLPPYSVTTITSTPEAGGKQNNIYPIAFAGNDTTLFDNDATGGKILTLNALSSSDPDGEIVNISWALEGEQISQDTNVELELPIGEYAVTLSVTDNDGARSIDTVFVNIVSPFSTELYFDVECANVGSTWEINENSSASNSYYVNTPQGTQSTSGASSNENDWITIPFTIEEEGNYKIWGRVIAPNADDDSFWIKVDDSDWTAWNSIPSGSSWHWDDVHSWSNDSPVFYNLTNGEHTLYICFREDGALLDKILIANTGVVPTGSGGDAETCSFVVPTTELWFEAECASVGKTWNTETDDNASNKGYITAPLGTENISSPSTNSADILTVTFDITEVGNYKVWGRVLAENDTSNSFWIKMDDSDWINWDQIATGNIWQWEDVHDTVPENNINFDLTVGQHTLQICFKEDGALLDKILITNTEITPTNLGGNASVCTIVKPTTELWFEAECMTVGNTWKTNTDNEASNQGYVFAPEGSENTSSASAELADHITATFNITEEGNYKVWGRVFASSEENNSFWIKMDDSDWINWDQISTGANWQWDDVHKTVTNNNVTFDLTTGEHTLHISFREDSVLLDKILIANTDTIPEGFGGNAETCTVVGVTDIENISQLNIYPNPAKNNIIVECENNFSKLEITTIDGKTVYSKTYKTLTNKEEIQLNIDSGIYFINVSSNSKQITHKLIVN